MNSRILSKEEIDQKLTKLLKVANGFSQGITGIAVRVPEKFIPDNPRNDDSYGTYTPGEDNFHWKTFTTNYHTGEDKLDKEGTTPVTIEILNEILIQYSKKIKTMIQKKVVEKLHKRLYEDEISHLGIEWIE